MSDVLYDLLPAALRTRDESGALRALCGILDEELGAIRSDIETTWDNWFIETCEEWLVPYIGEALGVRGLRNVDAAAFSLRSYVANTLERRRRKGTIAATEDLARDLTGYPARAVEMFAVTATTANVNHVRSVDRQGVVLGTVDLRNTAALLDVGGAFDPFVHTPDVRRMADNQVRHNLANVELFLWRLRSMEVSGSTARVHPDDAHWFRFDPLGADSAVFNLPVGEASIASMAERRHVPHPLSRLELQGMTPDDAAHWPIAVRVETDNGGNIDVTELDVIVCNLADAGPALPARTPDAAGVALVDPQLGRIVVHDDDLAGPGATEVAVDYVYGWPGLVGAGPYARQDPAIGSAFEGDDDLPVAFQCGVARRLDAVGGEPIFRTLEDAVVAWNAFIAATPAAQRPSTLGVIAVMDSRTHPAPTTHIDLRGGSRLRIVAARWPEDEIDGVPVRRVGALDRDGVRPHVVGNVSVRGRVGPGATTTSALELDGLLIEGVVDVRAGALGALDVSACTITGATVGIRVRSGAAGTNADLGIRVVRSIVPPITAMSPAAGLEVLDSMLGSDDVAIDMAGTAVGIESSTIRGSITCRTLDASNSVLDEGDGSPEDMFRIAQTQQGCLRFSYVPPGASTPQRYRCQPDLALTGITDADQRSRITGAMRPMYRTALEAPSFGLLRTDSPAALRSTADDGSEPGVWHHLQHARRISNLTLAFRQYLRFGLDVGYVLDRALDTALDG